MQSKKSKQKQRLSFPAIGTQWEIDIFDSLSPEKFTDIKAKVFQRIEEFDKNYSRFRKDSWVTTVSKKKGSFQIPHDFLPLAELYFSLNSASNGLFTPLIGQTLVDAGYDDVYSLTQKRKLVNPPPFKGTVNLLSDEIVTTAPVLLDFGAAGKGYLIDIIGSLLEDNNAKSYCIDAGGDILLKSNTPMRIGLEHPMDTSMAIGVAEITNESICGSSGNRRQWKGFHHTINPTTLTSPTEVIATWVIASSGLLSDGLATCLFLDSDISQYSNFKFEYVIMYKDNSIRKSDNFPGEFYTA